MLIPSRELLVEQFGDNLREDYESLDNEQKAQYVEFLEKNYKVICICVMSGVADTVKNLTTALANRGVCLSE